MLLTTLLAAAALHVSDPSRPAVPPLAPVPSGTSEQTAEGIEILRRLLVDSLDKAFADKKKDEDRFTVHQRKNLHVDGLVTQLWASHSTIEHSRAFHLPEVGLFFALDASLPMVARDKPEPAAGKSETPSGDEWDRIRREVRGNAASEGQPLRRFRFALPSSSQAQIDPKAIEQTIDLVLQTVARHAGRIEGLAPGETITVALRLSGRSHTLLQDFGGDEPGGLKVLGEDDVEAPEGAAGMFTAYFLSAGLEAPEQRLVIRVSLADLGPQAAASPEHLRQRAQVNLY